jgi:hypothetical protein
VLQRCSANASHWCGGRQQNLGVNSTFTLAAQQRHVSPRHWKLAGRSNCLSRTMHHLNGGVNSRQAKLA